MKRSNKLSLFCFIFLFFMFVSVSQAYAYLDPATGSMVVQAVIAALAAVGVAFSVFRRKLRAFVARIFRKEKNSKHEDISHV
jgi:hypothetical protein